jgi:hypothetical protein
MAAKPKTPKSRAENIVSPEDQKPVEPITTAVVADPLAAKKKTGRPPKYTPELAEEICQRLSNGEPLRQICRDEHMPAWQTIYDWMYRDDALGEKGVGLSRAIAHARDVGYDAMAEECLIIADTPQLGQAQVMDDKGSRITIEDMLGHRKLQIETRLKLLAKFNPKKYGDKVQVGGDPENPVHTKVTFDVFDTVLETVEARRQGKAHG